DSSDSSDDADIAPLSASALAFSKIAPLDWTSVKQAISSDPSLLTEETGDALMVEAFNEAMKGTKAGEKRARECIEKALVGQYCRALGRDGVALFFQRMTGANHAALKIFLDDVLKTSERIIDRAKVVAAERAAKAGNQEGVEQIQLVASSPDTTITFEVPDGPPPEHLEITGEGSEELDPVLVREFLQKRWDIFEAFPKNLKAALKEKNLEKVNKVLGRMTVEDAEQVVEQLQEAGILSFEQPGVIDQTGRGGEPAVEIPGARPAGGEEATSAPPVEGLNLEDDLDYLRTLVWLSVKPLIRVLIPIGVGFTLQRMGSLPQDATRSSSLLLVNLFLPCLLFSKIVPSFTSDNVPAIGPIILTAFFYQAVPLLLGILARAVTPTPRRWRWGVLSSYMFGNWGDLPSAVVLSITSTPPFNGAGDGDLGLAFVSVFILVVYISSFALQGIRIVQLDYTRQIDAALELRYEDGDFGTARKYLNRLLRGRPMAHELDEERARRDKRDDAGTAGKAFADDKAVQESPQRPRMVSTSMQTDGDDHGEITTVPLTEFPLLEPVPSGLSLSHHSSHLSAAAPSSHPRAAARIAYGVWSLIRPIFQSPPCIALLSALVISLVPTLRALFVAPTDGSSFHPTAPDGDPPLAVLYDTASFVGGASIPTGLTVLGASMGKIRLPRPIGRLPLASIASMSFVRLVIQPIIGFYFVRELVRVGMVSAEKKVLRFATLQVTYSILFAPPGQQNNSELVAAHLVFQYLVWAFSSVILTAFCLNDLF
ncbi:hypothetical protein JCM3770_006712, partial [Rhodotorula araucariae]